MNHMWRISYLYMVSEAPVDCHGPKIKTWNCSGHKSGSLSTTTYIRPGYSVSDTMLRFNLLLKAELLASQTLRRTFYTICSTAETTMEKAYILAE